MVGMITYLVFVNWSNLLFRGILNIKTSVIQMTIIQMSVIQMSVIQMSVIQMSVIQSLSCLLFTLT